METVGRYRLVRRLGAGSFATVWLGHDDDLDVPVAVKVLAENWSGNDDVRQRFLSEARILRRIRDRRIVQVYDIGTLPDGRPYFVMDYINGGSLDDLRKRGVDPARALRLCAEGCRALEVLHTNGVIHRDVTPGNILLNTGADGSTQVLLADLGVAKSMVDVGATMTAGTPSYMAPEQASGRGTLDRRADVYSLTALTYAMLSGRPPFVVRNVADIITRGDTTVPAPLAAAIGAPPSLDGLLVSGLANDPNRRPATAAQLADALDLVAQQMGQRAVVPGSPLTMPPGTPGTPPTPLPAPPAPTQGTFYPNPTFPTAAPPGGPDPGATTLRPRTEPPAPPPAPRRGLHPVVRILLLVVGGLLLFFASLIVTVLLFQ